MGRHRFIEGDIADPEACRAACEGVELVLHQAALGSVPRSIDDPLHTHRANATGFLNMLVAARDAGVARFVYAASSSTYGDSPTLPKVEDVIGRPLSPYAVTKYVNELYADVFGRCYGCATIGLRYFNVFGPRQDPEGAYAAVIPRWVAAMMSGETLRRSTATARPRATSATSPTRCRPTCSRRWRGPRASGQVYNVAAGHRTTLLQLHEMLSTALRDASSPDLIVLPPVICRVPRRRRAAFAGRHRQGADAAGLRTQPRRARRLARGGGLVRDPSEVIVMPPQEDIRLVDIIAGARPNFMKIAPIIRAIDARRARGSRLGWRLVHTGQHYDARMSADFFEQLNIPEPHVNLEVGSGTQAEQTAAIMVRYEQLLLKERSQLCLVVGDVTSTMACAIVAQKLCIPVAHVEAGIRSGDWTMPEEINRMVTDAITNYLLHHQRSRQPEPAACGACPRAASSSSAIR